MNKKVWKKIIQTEKTLFHGIRGQVQKTKQTYLLRLSTIAKEEKQEC